MQKPWTKEEDRRARAMRNEGMSYKAIGKQLRRGGETVRRKLRQSSEDAIETTMKDTLPDHIIAKVREMRRNGWSPTSIASELRVRPYLSEMICEGVTVERVRPTVQPPALPPKPKFKGMKEAVKKLGIMPNYEKECFERVEG